ncbi:MAG: hypothetical protein M0P37_09365 [Synergistaceae bacterium]|jgi:hypothetical protein|nr:hypothetical protein [Synergistaceae bacterium]
MGADFLLTFIPYPELTEDRRATIEATIDALAFEDIKEYINYTGMADEWDDDDQESVVNEIRQCVRKIVAEYSEMYRWRGTSLASIRGCRYLFAGGMSWGDSPSEEYDDISMLVCIDPIYQHLKAWALEDCTEA